LFPPDPVHRREDALRFTDDLAEPEEQQAGLIKTADRLLAEQPAAEGGCLIQAFSMQRHLARFHGSLYGTLPDSLLDITSPGLGPASAGLRKLADVIDTSSAAIRGRVLSLLDQENLPQIVQLGHPALRQQAVPFDGQLDSELLDVFLQLMRRVMHAAPGVGLAAPQLGVPLQLAVLEDRFSTDPAVAEARGRTPLPYFPILNPRYTALGERTASFFEGCLSFPGYQAVVERAYSVRLAYTRPDGTAASQDFHGWPARIVQHETDHLQGTIYIDKANTRSLVCNAEYSARWAQPMADAARQALGF
jgi:peptide deformylase